MRIVIDIELLVLIVLILIVLGWFMFSALSKKIARRRYKPENDKGKLGEEKRRRDVELAKEAIGVGGSSSSEGRSIFQATSPTSSGKDSERIRRKPRRRLFRRRGGG